ncbi:MAG: hypothetical protein IT204_13115 [Fimbriimonadaceae bacterium]|nr:hypothetical protein [Fimbriimonadaceae bacterium]
MVARRPAATALLAVWATLHLVLLPLHGRLHRDDCANDRCGRNAAGPTLRAASGDSGWCVVCVSTALPALVSGPWAETGDRLTPVVPLAAVDGPLPARQAGHLIRGPPTCS